MNDFDKLISIIDGKVKFKITTDGYDRCPQAVKQIVIQNSKGMGYLGFVSVWLFNEDGKLIAVGHYE